MEKNERGKIMETYRIGFKLEQLANETFYTTANICSAVKGREQMLAQLEVYYKMCKKWIEDNL